MLELLHIENIAVIEEADIQFHAGFNALTGETGAGKSIVIDAMGTVLGGRTFSGAGPHWGRKGLCQCSLFRCLSQFAWPCRERCVPG